jgi:uncharacterized membrane protein YfhO
MYINEDNSGLDFKHFSPSEDGSFKSELKLSFIDFWASLQFKANHFTKNYELYFSKLFRKIRLSPAWQVTGLLSLCAFLCFAHVLFTNGFTVPVQGDYSLQGMAFIYNGYDDWHYYFQTGVFPLWDTSGMLGVDNITANAFYYLYDPFFLALLIWPRSWLNQIQAIMMMVKLILAGLFFFLYLGEFNLKDSTKKFGALAYAFCGWGWFYLWFFHMQEVMTFLPLMLWGIEKIIKKKDPRLFTFAMFLMGATNYQFLAIFTVFSFFYALFRYFQTLKTRTRSDNWLVLYIGFVSFLIGIMLTAFIILPNYIYIQNMPRISSGKYLSLLTGTKLSISEKLSLIFNWHESYVQGLIGYDVTYRHLYPLESLFLINNSSFEEPLTHLENGYYDNVGSSIYVSVPALLLIVPCLIDSVKRNKWSYIIAFILMFAALEMPFTYYAAGLFANPYGRWELFVSFCLIVFVCLGLDRIKEMKKWYFDTSVILVLVIYFFVVKTAFEDSTNPSYSALNELKYNISLLGFTLNVFTMECVLMVVLFIAFYIYFRREAFAAKRNASFEKNLVYSLLLECVIAGNIGVQGQGYRNYYTSVFNGRSYYDEQTKIVQALNKYDTSFYRVFNDQTDDLNPNLAMAEGYNGIGAFNSNVNFDSEAFFEWSKLNPNSDSYFLYYFQKRYNFDALMGIKYYLVRYSATNESFNDPNVPYGFVDVTTLSDCPEYLKNTLQGNFRLYKNTNFIDTAFAFDKYTTEQYVSNNYDSENMNEINYLKKAIISSSYIEQHASDFADFEFDDHFTYQSYADTNLTFVNYSNLSKATSFYLSTWDYDVLTKLDNGSFAKVENSGVLRTLDSSMSDSAYSEAYASTLQADIDLNGSNSAYAIDSSHETSNGKTLYFRKTDSSKFFINSGDKVVKGMSSSSGDYFSKIVVDGGTTPICAAEASSKGGAYVSIGSPFRGFPIDYYLYGYDSATGNYKLLTHDFHGGMDVSGNYSIESGWQYARGFYVNEPVYKIVGLIRGTKQSVALNSVCFEYNDEYQSDIDKQKALAVDVTYRDANTIKYTSDYSSKKIVVLNQLYSTGWTLKKSYINSQGKSVDENVDLFKTDGGLLGYISGSGEENYVLSYYTPGLSTGLVASNMGLTFQSIMYVIYFAYDKMNKNMKYMKKAFSLKGL